MDSQTRPSRTQPDEMAQALVVGNSDSLGGNRAGDTLGSEVMKITAIYDNGGRSVDRYTIVTNELHSGNFRMALSVGSDPTNFSQWTGVSVGHHLGVIVAFEKLSGKLQEHIARRVFGKDN